MAIKMTPFLALVAVLSMATTYRAFGIRCQNPCIGKTCPIYKEAVCKPVRGPKICPDAAFFVGGTKVDCGPECLLEGACLLDACIDATCPKFPDATCVSNFCTGCKAEFYQDGKKVDRCDIPECLREGACLLDACIDAKCPNFPNARCISNFCTGCKAEFYQNGKKVDRCDIEICLDNVVCDVNPCDGKTCPAHPDATCKPNTCVGCNAEFFQNGKKVDC